ncbi:MAG TPA: Uma2 family endonuclease, partial [Trueperaceae bacterium]
MRDSPVPLVTVPAFLAALRAGALPEGPRAELLGGRVSPGHTPTPTQMAVIAHLYAALSRPQVAAAGGLAVVSAAFRLGPGDLLRADLALLRAPGGGRDAGMVATGVGGSHDPQAAFVVVELARGRATREERVPLYAAAGARELWLLDVARG